VQQAQRRRRWVVGLSFAPLVVLLMVVLVVGTFFQTAWAGSTLGLIAQTLQQVAAAMRWPLVLMLLSAGGIMAMIARLLRTPTTRYAVGAMVAAATLVVASTAAGFFNDRNNAQTARTSSTPVATIASPVETNQPVRGSITSLFGDIAIGQAVEGNVASLFGNVSLTAGTPVLGNVLVGGRFAGDPDLVTEGVVRDLDQLALASSVPGLSRVNWSPQRGRIAIALLGVVLLLALLGLTGVLWPDPLARASAMLISQTWPAVGLGTLLTALCALLAGPALALLAWSVLGLVALPLLGLALHLPFIFGLAVTGGAVAQRVSKRATLPKSLLANGAVLVVVVGLGLLMPLAGAVSFYLLASVGLGALLLSTRTPYAV
jgi:hypothetical protein